MVAFYESTTNRRNSLHPHHTSNQIRYKTIPALTRIASTTSVEKVLHHGKIVWYTTKVAILLLEENLFVLSGAGSIQLFLSEKGKKLS